MSRRRSWTFWDYAVCVVLVTIVVAAVALAVWTFIL